MSAGMLLHNIGKIMIIFDQNCTKIFTLIKITPVYDQLSDIILGTSTGPHKGDRKWRTAAHTEKSSRTNYGLEICFEVSRTLFALLNNF